MRVRFAPSPTGALHIGGARTALFNWLAARHDGGAFLLRIEDTDRERSTRDNVEQIFDALTWLGLDWDEDPVLQSQRAERHAETVERLVAGGKAYRSTATAEDVRAYKQEHGHDRGFRGQPEDEGAVRLRFPDHGETVVDDVVLGEVRFANATLDDLVIARADGTPVYNFAVAVDDLDMGITHVIRGSDHLSNTPKQLLVLDALGVPAPRYGHLPLLHGPDGKKLSKRHGAASVQELRDAGYLPEAVRNYIALLGWGPEDDETLMSTEELIRRFDVSRVSRNPAQFDEQKLRWMNGRYVRALSVEDLTGRLEAFTGRSGLHGAAEIAQEKISTLDEFWPLVGFLFDGPADDPKAREAWLEGAGREALAEAREALARVEPFEVAPIEEALREVIARREAKPREVFQPIRVALSGSTVSPGIYETIALVGRDETLARLDAALAA
jgi:glutamyl-tRNA synthetase